MVLPDTYTTYDPPPPHFPMKYVHCIIIRSLPIYAVD